MVLSGKVSCRSGALAITTCRSSLTDCASVCSVRRVGIVRMTERGIASAAAALACKPATVAGVTMAAFREGAGMEGAGGGGPLGAVRAAGLGSRGGEEVKGGGGVEGVDHTCASGQLGKGIHWSLALLTLKRAP